MKHTGPVFSLALLGDEVNQATVGVWENLRRLSGWFEIPLSGALAAAALHIVVGGAAGDAGISQRLALGLARLNALLGAFAKEA